MWSKRTPCYDYAKPLSCSLALHGVLAILLYLSPHRPEQTITPPVTVTLVYQQVTTHKLTQAQAISEPIKPHTTSPAKAKSDVVKTINTSSPTTHQASIEAILNTAAEASHELSTDTTKAIDTATLEQAKQDITKTDYPSTTEDIAEPIFDAAYLKNPKPSYPSFARRLQQQGIVKLRVKVSEQGLAEAIELAESSGFKLLDESAQKTVKLWRFVPAKRGTEAISAWVIVPIHFQLS
ncbi:energy transducer TonB [Agitococcus lubricus]|uniref:Protein TonB n=1 Tax=Agitococcus lubricus TaxID=1077255 RepID=A0A2T5J1Y7_9GAMM|nr:energy transducer TonB [Agitococcus lubricus]PTQ90455.1 protein TonB [Agitococcus lubricus]